MAKPNINWRDRYTETLETLCLLLEEPPASWNIDAAAINLGLLEEIRLGTAAGLLEGGRTTAPARPYITTCPACPHPRNQHGPAGCGWDMPDIGPCACERTYNDIGGIYRCRLCGDALPSMSQADLAAHARICSTWRCEPAAPEQADPVYVPKLTVPMRDEQPRHPDGPCGPGCHTEPEDPRDEPPHY